MSTSRFLAESLGLLSTYWSASGDLAAYEVDLTDDREGDVRSEVELRFALACSRLLLPVVARIERVVSVTPRLYRDRDVIPGPILDVPSYVQDRAARVRKMDYPILRIGMDHALPENMLVRATLIYLSRLLKRSRPRPGTIEAHAVRRNQIAVHRHLNARPWSDMPSRSLDALVTATVRRLNRGQIASPSVYREVIDVLNRMWIVSALPGDESELVDALVDFPGDPAFGDRVFEVWCLQQLANSFVRLGGRSLVHQNLAGPRSQPAMKFDVGGRVVDLFFQRSLPTQQLRYTYENGSALRGQPDTTLVRDDGRILLFDAKNRLATTNTRPEETFKLLGYFESLIPEVSGDGILVFLGESLRRTISTEDCSVELLAISSDIDRAKDFEAALDEVLSCWIHSGVTVPSSVVSSFSG